MAITRRTVPSRADWEGHPARAELLARVGSKSHPNQGRLLITCVRIKQTNKQTNKHQTKPNPSIWGKIILERGNGRYKDS